MPVRRGNGAQLEYYPGLTIPFPQAVFHQEIQADLEAGVRFGILEMWAAGRVERGEELLFHEIHSRTRICVQGRPVYTDALDLRPRANDMAGPGLLEGYRYLASGYWDWGRDVECSDLSCDGLELLMGRSPYGSLYLRGMAQDGMLLRKKLHEALVRQRKRWDLCPVDFGWYSNLFS